jgi:putative addiction module component (TIGR02574 family)
MIERTLLAKVTSLNPAERLELIGTLWDSLPHADLAVTNAERTLLDARLKDMQENSGDESSWPEVQARLQKPRR